MNNACKGLGAWAIGLCLWAISAAALASDAPVILIMGDSISAAYGMQHDQGWVSLLQTRLREQGYSHRIVNASISGETTAGGRTRLPELLKSHDPAVVIIELGGNDGLRGLQLQQTRNNLDAMIESAQSAGARVLLLGMRLPPNYGSAYTQAFEDIYAQLHRKHDTAFMAFFLEGVALTPGMMQADGIHPTEAAQSQLVNNVWPALEPLLEATQ